MKKFISDNDIFNISVGKCNDPFKFLGIHKIEETDFSVIRVFNPFATSIIVLTDDISFSPSMVKIHDNGLFEAIVKSDIKNYKLLVSFYDGKEKVISDPYKFSSTIGDVDEYLFNEGKHTELFNKLGAHLATMDNENGVCFAVFAPNAFRVSVVGDFNNWDGRVHVMRKNINSGIWDIFIPGIVEGVVYKYEILDKNQNLLPLKTDPFGYFQEMRPKTASVVYNLDRFKWSDSDVWNSKKFSINNLDKPVSIYEVHFGSWKKKDGCKWLSYRDMAYDLVPYVKNMGFTHIELMPIMEYPFDGSWGYQTTGMFAPTSRYGGPEDFQYFIDTCHSNGIGVILDWVSAHFPKDEHGLSMFDGTALYEYEDSRKGEHKDWGTKIYDYSKKQVVNFLLSSALFWVKKYRVDGIRFDAVASMLYLDYSRNYNEWVPNKYGGKENLEAIEFLKQANILLYKEAPNIATFAEESTSWKDVSKPTEVGGLGFGYKWNMGWMNDSLSYITKDPIYRKHHHGFLHFCSVYAFNENFVLPISHDEVVHGKKNMINKMPGDEWQKFANLRLFYSMMWTFPGKKLLFMGCEIAQYEEWDKDSSISWHLLSDSRHKAVQSIVRDLNTIYRKEAALYENDANAAGFSWICSDDNQNSVFSYIRYAKDKNDYLIIVLNMTPVVRNNYRIGIPDSGIFTEIFNSDDEKYTGSGIKNSTFIKYENIQSHGHEFSIELTLPPLGCLILKPLN